MMKKNKSNPVFLLAAIFFIQIECNAENIRIGGGGHDPDSPIAKDRVTEEVISSPELVVDENGTLDSHGKRVIPAAKDPREKSRLQLFP